MRIDPEEFDQHYFRAAYLFSRFTVPYMRSIYREFGGDMLLNLVLGEIGTRNVSYFFDAEKDVHASENVLNDISKHQRLMRPCNALSISEATGIPRETVRRKIDMLIKKGWVYKNEKGHIYLTPEVAQHFEHFLFDSIESLLPSAQALIDVLSKLPQPGGSKGRAAK
ncbi:MAG: hypothetical protein KBD60_10650 [Sterolibacterium sp.]|jgi:hypothetical protein|nr:hypothetical protein [Sterolibacterium sp.]